MVNDRFNYASTSEEFSVEAENLKGESVKEVAEAQEVEEEEQKTQNTSDYPPGSGRADRETQSQKE